MVRTLTPTLMSPFCDEQVNLRQAALTRESSSVVLSLSSPVHVEASFEGLVNRIAVATVLAEERVCTLM